MDKRAADGLLWAYGGAVYEGDRFIEKYLDDANTGREIMVSQRIRNDAKTMLEIIQHPERFCDVCFKRIGVCGHKRKSEVR